MWPSAEMYERRITGCVTPCLFIRKRASTQLPLDSAYLMPSDRRKAPRCSSRGSSPLSKRAVLGAAELAKRSLIPFNLSSKSSASRCPLSSSRLLP